MGQKQYERAYGIGMRIHTSYIHIPRGIDCRDMAILRYMVLDCKTPRAASDNVEYESAAKRQPIRTRWVLDWPKGRLTACGLPASRYEPVRRVAGAESSDKRAIEEDQVSPNCGLEAYRDMALLKMLRAYDEPARKRRRHEKRKLSLGL